MLNGSFELETDSPRGTHNYDYWEGEGGGGGRGGGERGGGKRGRRRAKEAKIKDRRGEVVWRTKRQRERERETETETDRQTDIGKIRGRCQKGFDVSVNRELQNKTRIKTAKVKMRMKNCKRTVVDIKSSGG